MNDIRVGVIGLGKIGQPITRNLLNKGFAVVVHNRSSSSTEKLVAAGATDGGSPRGVAQQADIVITSLPDPDAVRAVYLDKDGLVDSASSGQLYIDTSTVDPGPIRNPGTQLANALVLAVPSVRGIIRNPGRHCVYLVAAEFISARYQVEMNSTTTRDVQRPSRIPYHLCPASGRDELDHDQGCSTTFPDSVLCPQETGPREWPHRGPRQARQP